MSIETRSSQYGTIFEHWQIKELIGQGSGGKSAVFLLRRNDSFQEFCALKVINLIEERGRLEDLPDYRKKEYHEALDYCKAQATPELQMMLNLRGNSNTVDYLDHKFVNWSDAYGFGCDLLIRMELLTDLRSVIKKGRFFDEAEIIKIGKHICTALVLCHENRILHRDIKPENIFVNSRGNYKLGDFGISRLLDAFPGAMASTGIGTPEYAAPEQFTGKHDQRADIYSLGLVLYELSNRNKLPFAMSCYANQEDILKRQSGVPLPAPESASAGLWEVIRKACAYDPADRYQTARNLLDALCQLNPCSNLPRSNYETMPASRSSHILEAEKKKPPEDVPANIPHIENQNVIKDSEASPGKARHRKVSGWPLMGWAAGMVLAVIAFLCFFFVHFWMDATCTEGSVCRLCGKAGAPATGHDWESATCAAPKTCRICGLTEGIPLAHQWISATYTSPKTCALCGSTEGTVLGYPLTWCELVADSNNEGAKRKDVEIGAWEDTTGVTHWDSIRFWVADMAN